MRRLIIAFIVLLFAFSALSCSKQDSAVSHDSDSSLAIEQQASVSNDTDEYGHLALNDEMVDAIVEKYYPAGSLSSTIENKVINAANERIKASSSLYGDVKSFSDLKITSMDIDGKYSYKFYGTITGTDDYNKEISLDIYISFYCESSDNDTGYEAEYDGFNIQS